MMGVINKSKLRKQEEFNRRKEVAERKMKTWRSEQKV